MLHQLIRRPVKENLRLTVVEARQRIKHHHPVGHLAHGLHIVRDDDAGDRPQPACLQDQIIDYIRHDRIETGGRFVIEHHFRLERERSRQSHPLFHPARQFRRHLRPD